MADLKISQLTAITTLTPATDVLPVVDVTGTTKKITTNQILGSSGTATLASATISGDLTVRTNRLATTTTGVGIGTASPILPLDVRGGAGAGALFLKTTDPTAAVSSAYIQTPVSTGFSALVPIYGFWYQNCGMGNPASDAVTLITASTERYRIDSAGTNTWSNVGGAGTAMTLNSTGLGVGGSPTSKLHVSNTGAATRITITDDTTNGRSGYIESNFSDALVIGTTSGVRAIRFSPDNKPYYQIATDGVQTWLDGIGGTRMTLNSTGLGVGGSPTRKLSIVGSGATYANINSGDNTSLVGILLGGTSTPSAGQVIYDNTANSLAFFTSGSSRLLIDSSGNVGIGVSTFGTSAAKVLGLANATAPSTSPAGMGQLYVEAGALKYRGSSGTVTTIANA